MRHQENQYPQSRHNEVLLLGLIVECLCDDPACPLTEIHKLTLRERITWVNKLTIEEETKILNHYYWVTHQLNH